MKVAYKDSTRKELINSLRWALDYGTFEVAIDNPLHANALDEARTALARAEAQEERPVFTSPLPPHTCNLRGCKAITGVRDA